IWGEERHANAAMLEDKAEVVFRIGETRQGVDGYSALRVRTLPAGGGREPFLGSFADHSGSLPECDAGCRTLQPEMDSIGKVKNYRSAAIGTRSQAANSLGWRRRASGQRLFISARN